MLIAGDSPNKNIFRENALNKNMLQFQLSIKIKNRKLSPIRLLFIYTRLVAFLKGLQKILEGYFKDDVGMIYFGSIGP